MKSTLKILSTDLDGTLFPNGNEGVEPDAMSHFERFVKNRDFHLVYNSGRSKDEILKGVREFNVPYPDIMIGEVGTRIYLREGNEYREEREWFSWLEQKTPGWDVELIREIVLSNEGSHLQPEYHQNPYKVSFFLKPVSIASALGRKLSQEIRTEISSATTIYSVDLSGTRALFDVLPAAATKLHSLEYVRQKLGVQQEEVFFSGDSGNDLEALVGGYCGALVRNAIPEVQKTLLEQAQECGREDKVYLCQGQSGWGNGYYVSGILEGLAHFGFAPESPETKRDLA